MMYYFIPDSVFGGDVEKRLKILVKSVSKREKSVSDFIFLIKKALQ